MSKKNDEMYNGKALNTGVGIDTSGNTFYVTGWISCVCHNRNLVSLKVPDGVRDIYCEGNPLEHIEYPPSVHTIRCGPNVLDYDTCKIQNVNVHYW